MSSISIKNYDDLQGFVSASSTAALSISTGRQIRAFINGVSNIVLTTLLLLLVTPLVGVLYLFLAYQIWKLRHYVLKDFSLTLGNYKAYRQQLDKIAPLVDKLRPITNVQLNQIEWYARPFAKLAMEAAQIITARHAKLAARFMELDTLPANLPNGWGVISGQELWQGRPAGYEYLI